MLYFRGIVSCAIAILVMITSVNLMALVIHHVRFRGTTILEPIAIIGAVAFMAAGLWVIWSQVKLMLGKPFGKLEQEIADLESSYGHYTAYAAAIILVVYSWGIRVPTLRFPAVVGAIALVALGLWFKEDTPNTVK